MEPSKRARAAKRPPSNRGAQKQKASDSIDRREAARRIDDYIADSDDWRGERLAELRNIIHEVNPDVVEDWKWLGTPVWSHQGMFAHGNIFKAKVKLTLHHGAKLPDPDRLFNASLNANLSRAIDYHEQDKIDVSGLKTLLASGDGLQRDACGAA